MEALDEAKRQGKVRFVGFTGHKDPSIHLKMLRHDYPFDTCQLPLNCFDAGFRSFERQVLPELVRRGIAPLGMKSLGGEGVPAKKRAVKATDARRYAMSLPVATTIVGIDSLRVLRQDVQVARGFKPLSDREMEALRRQAAEQGGDGRFELYKTSAKHEGPSAAPSTDSLRTLERPQVGTLPAGESRCGRARGRTRQGASNTSRVSPWLLGLLFLGLAIGAMVMPLSSESPRFVPLRPAEAKNDQQRFLNNVVADSGVPKEELQPLLPKLRPLDKQLPVALFLARESGKPIGEIVELRKSERFWLDVMNKTGVKPKALFEGVTGEVPRALQGGLDRVPDEVPAGVQRRSRPATSCCSRPRSGSPDSRSRTWLARRPRAAPRRWSWPADGRAPRPPRSRPRRRPRLPRRPRRRKRAASGPSRREHGGAAQRRRRARGVSGGVANAHPAWRECPP